MSTHVCGRCGSEKVIPTARVAEPDDGVARRNLEIEVSGNPNALLFKNTYRSPLYARVCADCGYTELYAEFTRGLWEVYQEGLERQESASTGE